MKVLDLFSGTGGWSAAARERGHDVRRIERDPGCEAELTLDVGDIDTVVRALRGWQPDLLLASPPCSSFSTMSMGRMWTHDGEPKHPAAIEGRRLVLATLTLVDRLDPPCWILENPRARLRSLGLLAGIERRTVWYCHLGERRAKPTDLWGVFPPGLVLPVPCHNRRPGHGPWCCCHDHVAAPRGSRDGTQGGVSTAEAGAIPRRLSELVTDAAEQAMATRPLRWAR